MMEGVAEVPDHEPEATAALIALRRIVRRLRLADREVEASCGLSVAQLFVLHQLGETPALSIAELAERTLTDQSSVSTVVARLVEGGLIARRTSPRDGRRAELRITPRGQRLLRAAPAVPQTRMIEAIRAMAPRERAELVRALERLAAAMGAEEVAPRMFFEDEPPGRGQRGKRSR
jgi:DNA-binding MarR family transcriptional regulator